jgi:hypothetical protein
MSLLERILIAVAAVLVVAALVGLMKHDIGRNAASPKPPQTRALRRAVAHARFSAADKAPLQRGSDAAAIFEREPVRGYVYSVAY